MTLADDLTDLATNGHDDPPLPRTPEQLNNDQLAARLDSIVRTSNEMYGMLSYMLRDMKATQATGLARIDDRLRDQTRVLNRIADLLEEAAE